MEQKHLVAAAVALVVVGVILYLYWGKPKLVQFYSPEFGTYLSVRSLGDGGGVLGVSDEPSWFFLDKGRLRTQEGLWATPNVDWSTGLPVNLSGRDDILLVKNLGALRPVEWNSGADYLEVLRMAVDSKIYEKFLVSGDLAKLHSVKKEYTEANPRFTWQMK